MTLPNTTHCQCHVHIYAFIVTTNKAKRARSGLQRAIRDAILTQRREWFRTLWAIWVHLSLALGRHEYYVGPLTLFNVRLWCCIYNASQSSLQYFFDRVLAVPSRRGLFRFKKKKTFLICLIRRLQTNKKVKIISSKTIIHRLKVTLKFLIWFHPERHIYRY